MAEIEIFVNGNGVVLYKGVRMLTHDSRLVAQRYADIQDRIMHAAQRSGRATHQVKLIAVSKTFSATDIQPLLMAGHRCFGENRVQEARDKWPALRSDYSDVELHLIGPMQSNKVAEAVALFDVIQTVDRPKIAQALRKAISAHGKRPKLFVQVNTGNEPQKAGVDPLQTAEFVAACRGKWQLDIHGLMCIPPANEAPAPHFALLAKLAHTLNLEEVSMGMSADYETAIAQGATSVRVGSALFGQRGNPAIISDNQR